ncbi:tyrosine-type recombinase/integrase [Clostridium chromiireducens]|uniref:Tyrosine-type recombinase/integrase n=2 Tax=Clostridium chromiireducens TaxID=225345 RepID=A0A964RKD0_9CLOT|nr:tyrosine-type recombinase/integrase [Clostridium chromiireducens]
MWINRVIQFTKKRHTNATQLLGEGTDYKVIQSRLGHSDISTTLNIYFHATMEMQKSASKKISSLLSQNKKIAVGRMSEEINLPFSQLPFFNMRDKP